MSNPSQYLQALKSRLRYLWYRYESHVLIPIRQARHRIACVFGKHWAWDPLYLSDGKGRLGPYAGVQRCVSCGFERKEDWAKDLYV